MAKRGVKNKDRTLIEQDALNFDGLFTPLPVTPTMSPDPKKQRPEDNAAGGTSNEDILKAVMELTNRFVTLEQKLSRNTDAITAVCDQLKGVEIQVQKNVKQVKEGTEQVCKLQQRSDDAERYSRRWNLRLYGMKETAGENIRVDIMKLFAALVPEEKEKIGFLVDTVHRVGVPRDNANRPVIIQFTMRNFRDKIWKVSRENEILREKKLMLKEDLTHADRMERNRLWPLVEAARKQGKRASFRGPDSYIEGKKVTR